VRYHAADKTNAGTNELPSSHGPRVFWPANRAAHLHKLVLPERDGRHAGERERKAMCAAEGNRWSGEGHRLGTLQLYEKIGGKKSTMLCPWINSGITTNRPICNRRESVLQELSSVVPDPVPQLNTGTVLAVVDWPASSVRAPARPSLRPTLTTPASARPTELLKKQASSSDTGRPSLLPARQ
jgi:hypothetical protein